MAKRMLVDASHPEETRVVVLSGNRLEDFDYETASKKQLKGNIYLAKITRVEPSLQAAFVEYGGNRHGFLPFSEIHPDYYRIPIADRRALLAEDAKLKGENAEEEPAEDAAGEPDAETESTAPESDEAEAETDEDADAEDDGAANGEDREGRGGRERGRRRYGRWRRCRRCRPAPCPAAAQVQRSRRSSSAAR